MLARAGEPDPAGILVAVVVVAIDLAVSASDARRRGSSSAPKALMDARHKEGCRRHRRARVVVAEVHRAGAWRKVCLASGVCWRLRFASPVGSAPPAVGKSSVPFAASSLVGSVVGHCCGPLRRCHTHGAGQWHVPGLLADVVSAKAKKQHVSQQLLQPLGT